jgi:hypothetical protein
MLSKKYIVVLAVAGLMFSCQKEVIVPNNQEAASVSVDDNEPTFFRNSNTDASSNSSSSTIGDFEQSLSAYKVKDSEITDPNNDDDRNKKKKN